MIDTATQTLQELLSSNQKLYKDLSTILSTINDKCDESQIRLVQKSIVANMNYTATIVAIRQLQLIENIAHQLNLMVPTLHNSEDQAKVQQLAMRIDKCLLVLKNVNAQQQQHKGE